METHICISFFLILCPVEMFVYCMAATTVNYFMPSRGALPVFVSSATYTTSDGAAAGKNEAGGGAGLLKSDQQ
jgi:hypothetical protein